MLYSVLLVSVIQHESVISVCIYIYILSLASLPYPPSHPSRSPQSCGSPLISQLESQATTAKKVLLPVATLPCLLLGPTTRIYIKSLLKCVNLLFILSTETFVFLVLHSTYFLGSYLFLVTPQLHFLGSFTHHMKVEILQDSASLSFLFFFFLSNSLSFVDCQLYAIVIQSTPPVRFLTISYHNTYLAHWNLSLGFS